MQPNSPDHAASPRPIAAPYGLIRMLEDAVTAPFKSSAVFGRLAGEPPPGYGLMLAGLSVFLAAMFAVNLLHAAVSYPEAVMRLGPGVLAAIGLAAVGLAIVLSVLAAAVLHGLCLLAGGTGGFARSCQILSLLSALLPLQALLGWIPELWAAPTVLAATLCVVAAERLHAARPWRARSLFPAAAALSLLAAWAVRAEMAEYRASLSNAGQQLQAVERASEAMGKAREILAAAQNPQASPAALSGLDLLRGPGQAEPGGGQASAPPPEQAQALQKSSLEMMNAIMPMLRNPGFTKDMPPGQLKQIEELMKMLSQLQGNLGAGKRMTPQESRETTLKLQQMSLQLMQYPPQAAAPNPPASNAASQGGPK